MVVTRVAGEGGRMEVEERVEEVEERSDLSDEDMAVSTQVSR